MPRLKYIPRTDDYSRRKAVQLTEEFINNHSRYANLDAVATEALTDSLKYGTGIIHLTYNPKTCKVMYETVKPYEIFFDVELAGYDKHEDIHIVKVDSKGSLARRYPEYKDLIYKSQSSSLFTHISVGNSSFAKDAVICIESYSKISGRHTICVESVCLLDEDWEYENKYGDVDFPIAVMRYEDNDRHFYGRGVSEILKQYQSLITTHINTVMSCVRLAVPAVYVQSGSKVRPSAFNDAIGNIIQYDGSIPPTPGKIYEIPMETYQIVERLRESALAEVGLSQLSANSSIPVGLANASGKALETHFNIESDRFTTVSKGFERLVIDVSEKTIMYMSMLDKTETENVSNSKYYSDSLSRLIKWGDITKDLQELEIQGYPISSIPDSPEGRLNYVQQLIAIGAIDQQAALRLLELPDTEGYYNEISADAKLADYQVSKILEDSSYEFEPNAVQDFNILKNRLETSVKIELAKGVTGDVIDRLVYALNQTEMVLMAKAQAQAVVMQSIQADIQREVANGQSLDSSPNSSPSAMSSMASGSTVNPVSGNPVQYNLPTGGDNF
jgi:hypothetical protein